MKCFSKAHPALTPCGLIHPSSPSTCPVLEAQQVPHEDLGRIRVEGISTTLSTDGRAEVLCSHLSGRTGVRVSTGPVMGTLTTATSQALVPAIPTTTENL